MLRIFEYANWAHEYNVLARSRHLPLNFDVANGINFSKRASEPLLLGGQIIFYLRREEDSEES